MYKYTHIILNYLDHGGGAPPREADTIAGANFGVETTTEEMLKEKERL